MQNNTKQVFIPIRDALIINNAELRMCDTPGGFTKDAYWWRNVGGEVFVNRPNAVSFHIADGKQISYCVNSDMMVEDVQSVLMSTPFGTLIHQRQELPIHGAGLVAPGENGVTILCGNAGAGKSTTSALLCQDGWSLLADDVCRFSRQGKSLSVHRGYVRIKLMSDACRRIGIDETYLEPVNNQVEKFYWTPANIADPCHQPARMIILHRPAKTDKLDWGQCTGDVAIAAILPHVYRLKIGMSLQRANLDDMVKVLSATVPIYVLFVPPSAGPRKVADEIARFVAAEQATYSVTALA